MNHAGLLALLAATAFGLPLLTKLVEILGLPRRTSVVMTLMVMVIGLLWGIWRRRKSVGRQLEMAMGDTSPAMITPPAAAPLVRSGDPAGAAEEEEDDAGI